ncbi:MAG: hypothetical protein KOO61_09940 [Spirochaetales bacterium]|nr:hypothetical protein [Spirochaetales bacterium]
MNKSLTLIFNGEAAESQTISPMVRTFCSPNILRSCGGYIIACQVHGSTAYLGVRPTIMEGQRSNHYDLKVGPDTKACLIGGITVAGGISLLFRISKEELSGNIGSELRELYIHSADLLTQNGYSGLGILDWISRKSIQESEISSPVPLTILDLPVE